MLLLQKAMLLQQSTWQNNVRMGNLVEQVWVIDFCCIPLISHFSSRSNVSFLTDPWSTFQYSNLKSNPVCTDKENSGLKIVKIVPDEM